MPNTVRRFEDVLEEMLRDPETRAAYEALEPAYQVACRRIEQGLTQEELARRAGTKQPSIARLEAGRREPSLAYLRRVAAALGCRLDVRLVPQDAVQGTDSHDSPRA